MFKIFKYHTLYLRVHKTKIEIRNITNGKESIVKPIKTYSNSRLIIADFIVAEEYLRQAIKEVCPNNNIKILFQPIDENIKNYSPVETRSFIDSSEHAGAKSVVIDLTQKKLSDQEIIHLFD
jgi:hypothetical protein